MHCAFRRQAAKAVPGHRTPKTKWVAPKEATHFSSREPSRFLLRNHFLNSATSFLSSRSRCFTGLLGSLDRLLARSLCTFDCLRTNCLGSLNRLGADRLGAFDSCFRSFNRLVAYSLCSLSS